MRSLSLWLILGCISLSAVAAPTFTDQGTEAGYLNPADTEIVVQTVRVVGDSTYNGNVNAVQIRNYGGTANYQQITKIEVRNGGATICSINTPIGLTSINGVTIPSTHTITKGDTEDLFVVVWVGDVDAVQGGETLHFEVRFHYLLNGTAYRSGWVGDGKNEEIRKTGFETTTDSSPEANNFDPGNEGTVQLVSFEDRDANGSGLTLNKITVKNTGTATADDIASLKVSIAYTGGPWEETKTTGLAAWKDGGVVFDPDPNIGIADEGEVTVTVVVKIADPTTTVPADNRTIRNQATLEVAENGQTFNQTALSSTTQKIRRGGVEEIEDDSTIPASGVLNSGEELVQKIIVRDRDVNGERVNITRIWIKNLGTAEATEIEEIRVKSNGTPLGTFSDAQIADFLIGVWLDITDVLVANQGDRTFIIEYEIASGHTLKPQVKVEGDEEGNLYTSPPADYPQAVTLYPAGFELVENQVINTQRVYSGQRFCAQKILLKDIDENSDSVTINPVVPRNRGTATDTEIAKIEARTAAGDLLGETTEVGGLSAGGVAIPTLRNNVVADNGEVTLWIWVTLAGPEQTVTDHTIQLETTAFHAEGGEGYQDTEQGTSFTTEVNHRPTCDLDYTPSADLTYENEITFTAKNVSDADDDDIVAHRWEFSDGGSGTGTSVKHTFAAGGTVWAKLTVEDARGLTGSKTKTFSVEPPPVVPLAQFTWAPQAPATAEEVTFTDTSTTQAGTTITDRSWDLDGDGTEDSDAENPTHTYTAPGTYEVSLTVTNSDAQTDTVTHEVEVPAAKPTANFDYSPATPDVRDVITFEDKSTAAGTATITGWAWNLGDDTTSTAQNPTHTYTAMGTFVVSLTVTDSNGETSNAHTEQITVGPATMMYSYPNPASDAATIVYRLPAGASNPVLRIFDLVGRLVRRVELPVTQTTYVWNLTADVGGAVANGLYFCVVTAQNAAGAAIRSQIFKLLIDR